MLSIFPKDERAIVGRREVHLVEGIDNLRTQLDAAAFPRQAELLVDARLEIEVRVVSPAVAAGVAVRSCPGRQPSRIGRTSWRT